MSASNIDRLLNIWAASLRLHGGRPPFSDHNDLYATIDRTPLGDVPWQSFSISYTGPRPSEDSDVPAWMDDRHEVFFRDPHEVVLNMLANPDFKNEVDFGPVRAFAADGARQLKNFMSGDWAWRQAVSLRCHQPCYRSLFVEGASRI